MDTKKQKYTYKELREELAKRLDRSGLFPTATLSRWMKHLGYPSGNPKRKRWWEEEDVWAFYFFHQALREEGQTIEEAKFFTSEKIEQWRVINNGTEYRETKTGSCTITVEAR